MGIKGLTPDANVHVADTRLKLLAATKLPESTAITHNTQSLHAASGVSVPGVAKLSNEEQAQISKLKARDIQVHQHEQAHLSASAGLNVSSAAFTYQKGPNGVNYAVAGEVKIDTSPGRTPEETLVRAKQIADAALAPADPSPVDRSVAAKAQNMAQQAQMEIMQESNAETGKKAEQNVVRKTYDSADPPQSNIDLYA
jgi:hypothetical protein